ncbi:hypothetical protein FAF44_40660 [Nonomuraea sp. MG754425]|uniref:hypothetical protein n=1 Tax=Nonomuraea sp. MG754425 TaxID=2570319 RepID=UPI001F482EF3|nr:hypothetical protein [Nonomuraea sp. MG754425]MCF6474648.1 hypothetical protein [Nonomuraea sp. MG754425]
MLRTGLDAWEWVSGVQITSWSVRFVEVVLLLVFIPSTVRAREGARAVVLAILGITFGRMLSIWAATGYSLISTPDATLSQLSWIMVLRLVALSAATVVAFSLLATRESARRFWHRAGAGPPSTAARPRGVSVASWLLIGYALYQVVRMAANTYLVSGRVPSSIGYEISINMSGIVGATASIVLFFMIRRGGDVARLVVIAVAGMPVAGATSALISAATLLPDIRSNIGPWDLLWLALLVIACGAGVTIIVLLTGRDTADWFHNRRMAGPIRGTAVAARNGRGQPTCPDCLVDVEAGEPRSRPRSANCRNGVA